MIIVADTSPINYLVLIGLQEILPTLFGQIIIPEGVLAELQAPATPSVVGQWIANRPQWLEVKKLITAPDLSLSHLDEGEREALHLLKQTSFYISSSVEQFFLERDAQRKAEQP
jgi:predicted nucleic acid-binding protein